MDNPRYKKTYSRSDFTANGKLHYYGHTGEFDGGVFLVPTSRAAVWQPMMVSYRRRYPFESSRW